jgi:hypothetical protein
MNVRTDDELDRIFASFNEDRKSPAPRPLAFWVLEHPDLRTCFVQWATELPSFEIAESRPAYPEFEARSLAIGRSILDRLGLGLEETGYVSSLNDAARGRGLTPRKAAERLGVGMTLFAKLNRRLIRAASIPARLVERLAEELQVPADQIRAYLSHAPMLAAGAAYRSDQAPEVAEAEEFSEAVRNSADMNEEQKVEWVE